MFQQAAMPTFGGTIHPRRPPRLPPPHRPQRQRRHRHQHRRRPQARPLATQVIFRLPKSAILVLSALVSPGRTMLPMKPTTIWMSMVQPGLATMHLLLGESRGCLPKRGLGLLLLPGIVVILWIQVVIPTLDLPARN